MAMFPVLCLDVSPTGIVTLTAFDVQVPELDHEDPHDSVDLLRCFEYYLNIYIYILMV